MLALSLVVAASCDDEPTRTSSDDTNVSIAPRGIAVSPDGGMVYVANAESRSVTVIGRPDIVRGAFVLSSYGASWDVAFFPDWLVAYVSI